MAKEGFYGEAGKPNESPTFAIPGIGGVLSVEVNKQTGTTQVYRQGAANTQQSLGTYNPSTKKFTPQKDTNGNLIPTEAEIKALSSTNGTNAINNAAKTTATKGIIAEGKDPQTAQKQSDQLLSKNSGNSPEEAQQTQALEQDLNSDATKNLSRSKFPQNLKYPENLKIESQDVIKFNMIKYSPKPFKTGGDLNPIEERRKITNESIIGSVYLPIPGGISDSNAVNWAGNDLNALQAIGVDIAKTTITEGFPAGADKTGEAIRSAADNSKTLASLVANRFTEAATGTSNILSRTEGAISNPNMELLFQSPTLRPFNFAFKLSARGQSDREQIRQIIRFFKQGMAAQRTAAGLFLKAPHTFKIQYLHKNKDHPYINLIKECALLAFTVNYTPEGNYMTFSDGLMTSYEISMQFQELEPIFNDDYDKFEKEKGLGQDSIIGY